MLGQDGPPLRSARPHGTDRRAKDAPVLKLQFHFLRAKESARDEPSGHARMIAVIDFGDAQFKCHRFGQGGPI